VADFRCNEFKDEALLDIEPKINTFEAECASGFVANFKEKC
jgi:hypothetical protein